MQQSSYLEAFGQTWTFTRDAMACLAPYGIRSSQTLKVVIINLTSSKGLEDGEYEMQYSGAELKVTVKGSRVVVDDRFAPAGLTPGTSSWPSQELH